MSVELGPGFSVVLKKAALSKLGNVRPVALGEVRSEDDKLMVLGPFFDTKEVTRRLDELGLVYFEDYFDLPHTGGEVPDWCRISLRYSES